MSVHCKKKSWATSYSRFLSSLNLLLYTLKTTSWENSLPSFVFVQFGEHKLKIFDILISVIHTNFWIGLHKYIIAATHSCQL